MLLILEFYCTYPITPKDYAKFVLRDGTVLEQRSVLECMSSELVLKNRNISI